MSPDASLHHDEADPFRVLHDVLGSHASLIRKRVRHFHQLVNIRRLSSRPVLADSRSSGPDGQADSSVAEGKGSRSDLDYISGMDWGSPPRSAIPPIHADTARHPRALYVEDNLIVPQSPNPLLELKDPGPLPSEAEVQLRRHKGHDLQRIVINWRLLMTNREVELQLVEKHLAARFNPFNELVRHVTVTPVERSPSPPPAFPLYPLTRDALMADPRTEPTMPLSLIPTERRDPRRHQRRPPEQTALRQALPGRRRPLARRHLRIDRAPPRRAGLGLRRPRQARPARGGARPAAAGHVPPPLRLRRLLREDRRRRGRPAPLPHGLARLRGAPPPRPLRPGRPDRSPLYYAPPVLVVLVRARRARRPRRPPPPRPQHH